MKENKIHLICCVLQNTGGCINMKQNLKYKKKRKRLKNGIKQLSSVKIADKK